MRRYRLEIAVKRLYGLVHMSSSARILFSVRFSTFPEIFIRPQEDGGGGVVEISPAGDRIVSLTYCVCHKAEFQLHDNELRKLFPAQCFCRVYDDSRPSTSGTGVESSTAAAAAALSWACPCPLTTERGAESRHHSSYAMCDAAGQTMGFAEMSCRVVAIDSVSPSSLFSPKDMTVTTASGSSTLPTSGGHLTVNGKPYVIRVTVSDKKKRKDVKTSKGCRHSPLGVMASGEQTGTIVAVNDPSLDNNRDDTQDRRRGSKHNCTDSRCDSKGRGERETVGTAKKKTLLYVLQYDVAYQIQSSCETLYATLKREFTPLDTVSVNEKSKPMIDKVDNVVQGISKLANIALQLANQLIESAGETYTNVSSEGKVRHNPVNKLPIPHEGSVAHFLMYQVLFQLQCLGTSICNVTAVCHQPLEVPLSSLHSQHIQFIKKLALEVQELSRSINIIVQSTIDGTFGSKNLALSRSASTYSSSFSSSSDSSSLSSRSSSNTRSEKGGYSIESVPNISLDDKTTPSAQFPVVGPSVTQTVVTQQSKMPLTEPTVFQGYSSKPLSSSSPPTSGEYPLSALAAPANTLPHVLGISAGNFHPSHTTMTPLTTNAIGKDLPIQGTASATPQLSVDFAHGTPQQGVTIQNTWPLYNNAGSVPVPQPIQPSVSSVGNSVAIQGSSGITGSVPVPQPVQASSSSVGNSVAIQRPSGITGSVPVPQPVQASSSSVGNSAAIQGSSGITGSVPVPQSTKYVSEL